MASREAYIDYMALRINTDLPVVMNFHLVAHLPRLFVMAAIFFMCERKVTNLIY